MNIFETIGHFLAEPRFLRPTYGDFLHLCGIIIFFYPAINPWLLCVGAVVLYPFLNYYQQATGQALRNAILEEPSSNLLQTIANITLQEGTKPVFVKEVTNFAGPAIIVNRFINNPEIYVASTWNDEKYHNTLSVLLRESLKSLAGWNSRQIFIPTLFAIHLFLSVPLLLSVRCMFDTTWTGIVTAFLAVFLLEKCFDLIKSNIYRNASFNRDIALAKAMGKQQVIDAYQEFNTMSNFDQNMVDVPEWAMAIPKFSSRIKALSESK